LKQFQKNANDLEAKYKTADCALMAKRACYTTLTLFNSRNKYKQVKFDRALDPKYFTQAEEDEAKAKMEEYRQDAIKRLKELKEKCSK